jgi:phosphoglucomutase
MTPLEQAKAKAALWKSFELDNESRNQLTELENGDQKAFIDAFYSDLEFGTGGLRGEMGMGSMRMNRYTVGMATQGLAQYILDQVADSSARKVAIAHDSRHLSPFFTTIAAEILSANGIEVHVFAELRPTPLLSFAVRELGCTAGIVITASHNPKEYNGYKVYWADGGQIVSPHDKGIITEVRKITNWSMVQTQKNPALIKTIAPSLEASYLQKLQSICLSAEEIAAQHDLPIVYTPIHGSGITMVPKALETLGFGNVTVVAAQATPDGAVPTVDSPNPEERSAMKLALELAEESNAALVLGTDPDADRVGIAIRNDRGRLVLLNGNQAGSLLVYYRLLRSKELGLMPKQPFVAKTIVTSSLIEQIAHSFQVPCYDTLTGFKYIANLIKEKEGTAQFMAGGEESYGYLVSDFVRDKDAVLSACQFAEMAAYAKAKHTTLWRMLEDLYLQHGVYVEDLVSLTLKGLDGLEQIKGMMHQFRTNPPIKLAGSLVQKIADYQTGILTDVSSQEQQAIELPKSNVLQFILADGSKISIRPSGTEPKIKFYFSFREDVKERKEIVGVVKRLKDRIEGVMGEIRD